MAGQDAQTQPFGIGKAPMAGTKKKGAAARPPQWTGRERN